MSTMATKKLIELYKSHRANCCNCGCELEYKYGDIGSVFVLDKKGDFYCSNCDKAFCDVDERIFELDLAIDEMNENKEKYLTKAIEWISQVGGSAITDFVYATGITTDMLDYLGFDKEDFKEIYERAEKFENLKKFEK